MIASVLTVLGLKIMTIASPGVTGAQGYWDWQLTEPYNLELDVRILALDGEAHDAQTIARLNARGVKTLCYISIGTWEDWRADKDRFPPEVLGKPLGDWPGEQYLDIRRTDILGPIMFDRIAACKERGFAGIEPDNMDVFDNDSGFPLSEADGVRYLRMLADYAHALGMEIGQKNAPQLIPQLVGSMDFLLIEDCFVWDFCTEAQPYLDAGKDVLAVEYTDSDLDWEATCEAAKGYGFHLLLKDREVTAGGKVCLWE